MTGLPQHPESFEQNPDPAIPSSTAANTQATTSVNTQTNTQTNTQSNPPELPPYNASLTRVVIPGTALWFLGFVVLLFFISDLREHNAMIWLWTCLTGWILGLVGLALYRWQRLAARRGSRGAQTSALD